jgi:hypothetical protein
MLEKLTSENIILQAQLNYFIKTICTEPDKIEEIISTVQHQNENENENLDSINEKKVDELLQPWPHHFKFPKQKLSEILIIKFEAKESLGSGEINEILTVLFKEILIYVK